VLAGKEGQPPVGAVVLQGALAMLLLLWSDVASVLSGVGELFVSLHCSPTHDHPENRAYEADQTKE
jgi:hypothetical protein